MIFISEAACTPAHYAFAQYACKAPADLVGGKDITFHMDISAGHSDIRQHGFIQRITFYEQHE